jgi:hypothetical protein
VSALVAGRRDSPTPAEPEGYRAERLRRLERENEYVRAERDRLLVLLADALRIAVAGTPVGELVLLDVLAALRGTNLGRGAFIEVREGVQVEARHARLLAVLRETAPELHAEATA